MDKLRDISGRTRLFIAAIIGMSGLIWCLLLAAAGIAALRARTSEAASPTAALAASSTVEADSQPTEESPVFEATSSPTIDAVSPTSTGTASATATATRRPATSTPPPPTATATEAPLPDYRCVLSHMGENNSGEQVFSFEFENFGDGEMAGSYQVTWTLIGSGGPEQEGGWQYESLAPGESTARVFNVNAPNGNWTMQLFVDSTNAIAESNEGNNKCQANFSTLQITLVPVTLSP